MKRVGRLQRRFSVRLLAGFVVLILLTTLSAGVPAYWVTRAQLEQQAWEIAANARQATVSLLAAEEQRLSDLSLVLAERPTLNRLLREQAFNELPDYLQAFQDQSNLDILYFCIDNRLVVGESATTECPSTPSTGFAFANGRPVLLSNRSVFEDTSTSLSYVVTIGLWLDEEFLRQLASSTGVEQSILLPDGQRLTSSFLSGSTSGAAEPTLLNTSAIEPGGQVFELAGRRYYTLTSPIIDEQGQPVLLSEVALEVGDLLAAERRALAILTWSTGLVALLGTVLGLWYVRQVIAPLRKLTAVAEQISQGDLVASIPNFENPVEVGTLATALQQSQASMLRAIEERSQARDWLDTLIQSVVEGVVTFDAEGRITFLSQGAELLSGWRREDALARHVNDVFPVTRESEVSFLEALPPPGEKRQISVHTQTGKSITLAVTGARLVPPGEETVQMALVLRDVTQEEALRHLRSYFLSSISHEFRTPLSTLNASIELLLEEVDTLSAAEIRELLKPTYLSLRGLQNLIDNLLESSSIEAGRFVLHQRRVDLNQVIHDALGVVQPLFDRRRQQVMIEEPAHPPELIADPARLTQVLVNLLTNAGKYSPIGAVIEIRVRQSADMLRLSVADRGPGIPPDERANVFRRFVRLTATDGEHYGVGLGLFVVRTTIEAHGGRVGVDGRSGGGSIFWFELPLAQPNRNNTLVPAV